MIIVWEGGDIWVSHDVKYLMMTLVEGWHTDTLMTHDHRYYCFYWNMKQSPNKYVRAESWAAGCVGMRLVCVWGWFIDSRLLLRSEAPVPGTDAVSLSAISAASVQAPHTMVHSDLGSDQMCWVGAPPNTDNMSASINYLKLHIILFHWWATLSDKSIDLEWRWLPIYWKNVEEILFAVTIDHTLTETTGHRSSLKDGSFLTVEFPYCVQWCVLCSGLSPSSLDVCSLWLPGTYTREITTSNWCVDPCLGYGSTLTWSQWYV